MISGLSMGGIADHWPVVWLVLRLMLLSVPVGLIAIWPLAVWLRHRAYGPGGGRRAPGPVSGDAWRLAPVDLGVEEPY
jgi:hypothetical protein